MCDPGSRSGAGHALLKGLVIRPSSRPCERRIEIS
jgi:hypothetical protein